VGTYTTTGTKLYRPILGENNWDDEVNTNFDRLSEFGTNVKSYGALGIATDDTASFNAALAAIRSTGVQNTGTLIIPPGWYILDNWQIAAINQLRIIGSGPRSTVLQAKPGAAAAATFTGFQQCHIEGVGFNGNGHTAKGLILKGNAQNTMLVHDRFENATTGCEIVANGANDQVDKNTFINCQAEDSTIGLHVNAVNAQGQIWIGGSQNGCTTGVRLTQGTYSQIGGMSQNCTTSYLLDGGGLWFGLEDVITEGEQISIGGSNFNQVALRRSYLQGSVKCIDQHTFGGTVFAEHCTFNNGPLSFAGNDTVFLDTFCTFNGGAIWAPDGDNHRRISTDGNGVHYYINSTTAKGHQYVSTVAPMGKAGIPADGDIPGVANQMMVVDSANSRLYVRVGGVWKYAALT
jgi:hypothetical protein